MKPIQKCYVGSKHIECQIEPNGLKKYDTPIEIKLNAKKPQLAGKKQNQSKYSCQSNP